MRVIRGVVKDGRVEVDVPEDWPDGSEVQVEVLENTLGMQEEDWPTTQEGIEILLKKWESIEPLEFSPREESQIEEDRQLRKERELANFDQWSDRIGETFE